MISPSRSNEAAYVEPDASLSDALLLLQEREHRIKNTFVVMQAVAWQTLKDHLDPETMRLFERRIVALAMINDVLASDQPTKALSELVEKVVGPYRLHPEQIRCRGEELEISAGEARLFMLALNELCVNAVKYGALSVRGGSVNIDWTLERRSGGYEWRFTWREQDGPEVVSPTRVGFGRRMIDKLAVRLSGKVDFVYDRAGVICSLTAPWKVGLDPSAVAWRR